MDSSALDGPRGRHPRDRADRTAAQRPARAGIILARRQQAEQVVDTAGQEVARQTRLAALDADASADIPDRRGALADHMKSFLRRSRARGRVTGHAVISRDELTLCFGTRPWVHSLGSAALGHHRTTCLDPDAARTRDPIDSHSHIAAASEGVRCSRAETGVRPRGRSRKLDSCLSGRRATKWESVSRSDITVCALSMLKR